MKKPSSDPSPTNTPFPDAASAGSAVGRSSGPAASAAGGASETDREHNLKVVRQPNRRFLFNQSDMDIYRLVLTDRIISFSGGVEFPAPIYEMRDLPAGTYTKLPDADEFLDGVTIWDVMVMEWTDGVCRDGVVRLSEHKKWGGATFDERRVDRDFKMIACTLGREFEPPE